MSFELLLKIRNQMEGVSLQGTGSICGELKINNGNVADVDQLVELDVLQVEGYYPGTPFQDETYSVSFETASVYRNYNCQFFDSIDHFLERNISEFPTTHFFIFSHQYDSQSDPQLVELVEFENYLQIFKLLKMLSVEQKDGEIIFIDEEYEKFTIKYTKGYLSKFNQDMSDCIACFNNSEGPNSAEFKLIIKNRVAKFIKRFGSNDISIFAHNASEFGNDVMRDYQIFLNKFSIEKVKAEFLELRENYLQKIDDLLKSISKEIIAIPVGILLSFIVQLKISENPAIIISMFIALIAFIFMQFRMIRIQGASLKRLKKKVAEDEDSFKKHGIYEAFKQDFNYFHKKNRWISQLIITAWIMLGIFTFIVTCLAHQQFWPKVKEKVGKMIVCWIDETSLIDHTYTLCENAVTLEYSICGNQLHTHNDGDHISLPYNMYPFILPLRPEELFLTT